MQDHDAIVEQVAALFDRLADVHDGAATRFHPFAADRLVDWMRLRPGMRVLDAGTGTGAVAVAAAQRIRPEGRVQAIDLSERMLDVAHANLRRMALDNVDLYPMDLRRPEFRSDYFDVILSGFALPFVPDMGGALRAWQRILKPGGRVAFTVLARGAFEPLLGLLVEDLETFGFEFPDRDVPFAWFRLQDANACRALLAEAGYEDIEVETTQVGHHIEKSLDWWELIERTPLIGYVDALEGDTRKAFEARHMERAGALFRKGELWLDIPVHMARGVLPATG
ncbi:MAG TPA: methyltransferase domain-containing protein [Thiotrichales bacterium]|nr:methyltransferase domain-containing protein [Thiotrichales bacterium]